MSDEPFHSDECYVICHCEQCKGRTWDDIDELMAHVMSMDRPIDLDIIDVGDN